MSLVGMIDVKDNDTAIDLLRAYAEVIATKEAIEEMLAGYMGYTDRPSLVVGDLEVRRVDPGKTYNNRGAAEKVFETEAYSEEQIAAILEEATPEPKVSWSKVVKTLGIKTKDIPYTVDGEGKIVFYVDGVKKHDTDFIRHPEKTPVNMEPGDEEPSYVDDLPF